MTLSLHYYDISLLISLLLYYSTTLLLYYSTTPLPPLLDTLLQPLPLPPDTAPAPAPARGGLPFAFFPPPPSIPSTHSPTLPLLLLSLLSTTTLPIGRFSELTSPFPSALFSGSSFTTEDVEETGGGRSLSFASLSVIIKRVQYKVSAGSGEGN
jgi:hypothetical protein